MDVSHLEPSELGYLESQGYTHRDLELLDPIEVGFLIPDMSDEEKLFYTDLEFQSKKQAEAEAQRAIEHEQLIRMMRDLEKETMRDLAYKQSLAEIYALGERQRSSDRLFNACSFIAIVVCIALAVSAFVGK